ncbi:MAG TPA: MaoC family dehydratase [Candidatus Sulfotelmatobacter sp.]|nr:MaoC family dehydratase [Candidatus Sulfotelmatobacter sp.]
MAGDLSPLTIEANAGSPRHAPPALVVAIAVGLGSVDTPVPSVAEWEWLNWKFPREVRAGDTIYARWTLTQKRPPVAGAPSSIVVWRVDVHLLDGALCAEGEVGAKVNRKSRQPVAAPKPAAPPAASGAAAAPRRRRRRPRANGGVLPEPPSVAAPPPAAAKPERTSSPSRRRRRRRSGAGRGDEEHEPRAPHVQETAPAPPVVAAAAPLSTATRPGQQGTIGKVLRRLRGST